MAPEAILNLQFSTKSDVWAFGVTAYEIFIREEPFTGRDPVEVAMAVCRQNLKPVLPKNFPQELVAIFNKCFETNPDSRPTTAELLAALQLTIDPTTSITSAPLLTQYGSVTAVTKANQTTPAPTPLTSSQYGSVTAITKETPPSLSSPPSQYQAFVATMEETKLINKRIIYIKQQQYNSK